ncbi:MAG: glycosyltransferase [Terriglobia bacterium]
MAEGNFLSDDFLRQLTAVGAADILVGIPTANNHETIQHVVNAVQIGLVKYFPRDRAVLINPDGGSRDDTPALVKAASVPDFRSVLSASPLRTLHMLSTRYHPGRGLAGAFRLVFAAADLLRARACAVVSPDVISITPEWIDALVRPVYREGFDLVTPLYQRHKFDALLVKNILSPFIRAAYGYQIEEPAAGEWCVSGKLACYLLEQEVWHEDFMRFGSPLWMTATALAEDFRLCQSFLGPRIRAAHHPDQDLPAMIQQTVGTLFRSLEVHQPFWLSRNGSQSVPAFGFQSLVDLSAVRVNRKRLLEMFQNGVEELSSILEMILSAATLQEIREVSRDGEASRHFTDELWVKTVYEFAASYHRSVMNRDHLLQALTPLYRGRISSYIAENHGASLEGLRRRLESLQQKYESLKPYLIQGWLGKA